MTAQLALSGRLRLRCPPLLVVSPHCQTPHFAPLTLRLRCLLLLQAQRPLGPPEVYGWAAAGCEGLQPGELEGLPPAPPCFRLEGCLLRGLAEQLPQRELD